LASDTCLLIGINPRYEGSELNLKLKARYLKGNFNIICIGSLCHLTFPNINIGNNVKILKSLVEGNNLFCQDFANSLNPILISNTETFRRKDSLNLINMLKSLIKYISLFSHSNEKNKLNLLNLSLNSAGFLNINNLKTINNKDFKDSIGVYFINNSLSTSNIKKLLSLRLLNFFQNNTYNNKTLITQSSDLNAK